ncbi:MAG: alpha/beta hydrolase [Pseudomonadota bacterium]
MRLAPGARAWTQTLALTTRDGVGLRGALWAEGTRGLVVVLPGRTEFLEKVAILAGALQARGFAVASLDWRGQGQSARLVEPPAKSHVGCFSEYHLDLQALLDAPEVAALGAPRLVLAHSMGATVALGAREAGVLGAIPTVYSAPMLAIRMALPTRAFALTVMAMGRRLGLETRWPPLPGAATPYVLGAHAQNNTLTFDKEVFAWLVEAHHAEPRIALGLPSIGWFLAAEAAMAKARALGPLDGAMVCLLGQRECVVASAPVHAFAARQGMALIEIPRARHDLFLEGEPMRSQAWAAVDAFLAREGL